MNLLVGEYLKEVDLAKVKRWYNGEPLANHQKQPTI